MGGGWVEYTCLFTVQLPDRLVARDCPRGTPTVVYIVCEFQFLNLEEALC